MYTYNLALLLDQRPTFPPAVVMKMIILIFDILPRNDENHHPNTN